VKACGINPVDAKFQVADKLPEFLGVVARRMVSGKGLHLSTFHLNLSALYGIGGAHRGCVARVKGVLGGV